MTPRNRRPLELPVPIADAARTGILIEYDCIGVIEKRIALHKTIVGDDLCSRAQRLETPYSDARLLWMGVVQCKLRILQSCDIVFVGKRLEMYVLPVLRVK